MTTDGWVHFVAWLVGGTLQAIGAITVWRWVAARLRDRRLYRRAK